MSQKHLTDHENPTRHKFSIIDRGITMTSLVDVKSYRVSSDYVFSQ
jgi:hypothetical protein